MKYLDIFEENVSPHRSVSNLIVASDNSQEYTREAVEAHALEPFLDVSSYSDDDENLIPAHPPPLPESFDPSAVVQAETYIYCVEADLVAELWSFEDFVKGDSAQKWYDGTRGYSFDQAAEVGNKTNWLASERMLMAPMFFLIAKSKTVFSLDLLS